MLGSKRRLADTHRARRAFAANALRPARYAPPPALTRRVRLAVHHVEGWPVYEITPAKTQPGRTVVYWHGGAYVNEIMAVHWWFLSALAAQTQTRVIVPIYPLGAALGASRVVHTSTSIARHFMDEYGSAETILMGDSAGGGLALAVAQQLRTPDVTAAGLVLISPWLDAELSDPRQPQLEPKDAMLGIAGLREAARQYADGLPLAHRLVSPINGNAAGLPPVTIFTSTADLLSPDSYRFAAACAAVGTPCQVLTTPGALHVFPVLPTPEGRAARAIIGEVLTTTGSAGTSASPGSDQSARKQRHHDALMQ